mmetsp:Transcript_145669/g.265265  ORF Transcript_145669/g.265265 Transcript_145669/m.265265 type:complete len:209 (+) Transcript_145669:520-1146(+)
MTANLHQVLLIIEGCKSLQGLHENAYRCPLVSNSLLELEAFLDAVLCSALQFQLQICNVSLGLGNRVSERLNLRCEACNLLLLALLFSGGFGCVHLILLDLSLAIIICCNFILLLLLQHGDHLVNCRFDFGECIELHAGCHDGQLWAVSLGSCFAQHLRGTFALELALLMTLRRDLCEAVGVFESIPGTISSEDANCFRHCLNLSEPC